MGIICGCDETGRGSGAAEIFVCACILNPDRPIIGLKDSKKLTAKQRETLAHEIKQYALSWCIAKASLIEIEQLNVHHATLLAMKRAIQGLTLTPDKVLIDGCHIPKLDIPAVAIIKGDDKIPAISAASILAKVTRDHVMTKYHQIYPEYGFDVHKGYFTKRHLEALKKYGPCPIHRKSYAPIRAVAKLTGRH